jgi:DNA-binding CsgD family transcriptional regulator
VLTLLVQGKSNLRSLHQLSITLATVKFHLMNVYSKLGSKSRVEAVTIALENHLASKGS